MKIINNMKKILWMLLLPVATRPRRASEIARDVCVALLPHTHSVLNFKKRVYFFLLFFFNSSLNKNTHDTQPHTLKNEQNCARKHSFLSPFTSFVFSCDFTPNELLVKSSHCCFFLLLLKRRACLENCVQCRTTLGSGRCTNSRLGCRQPAAYRPAERDASCVYQTLLAVPFQRKGRGLCMISHGQQMAHH